MATTGQNQEQGSAGTKTQSSARPGDATAGERQSDLYDAFVALRLLAKSEPAADAAMRLAFESLRIGVGASEVEPKKQDWRFRNAAWADHPAFKMMAQSYLAWSDAVSNFVEGLDTADWRDKERARFAGSVLTSAFAPTNFLLSNPAALQKAFETGGGSLVRGFQNYLRDLAEQRTIPTQVDTSSFEIGKNMAASEGAVVFRNAVIEVLQYRPPGAEVRARPLLIVPPPIGKYYFLDLAPQRSFFGYALGRGLNLFTISWRNPTPEQAAWDFDTYAGAIVEAIDVVREIAGSRDVNTMGFCAGGILLTAVLAHLAARNDKRVHASAFAVMLLDFDSEAAIGSLSASEMLSAAEFGSAQAGVLEAKNLAAIFAWMRPNDLVWNYWVNNYLMGEKPPASDLMAWNADGTNLPAALHKDFLSMFGDNKLVTPGAMTVLGTPIDLGRIKQDAFVMAAIADHLTPWQGCYRATQLFGGDSTFVLSNAGHIAGLVNPPGNPKSKYFAGPKPGQDPNAWLAQAQERPGTWWEQWGDWVAARSGDAVPAPQTLGSAAHPAREPAPGRYIHT